MMKISPMILMFTIFASSMSSYAGFADSLRDLRGTLSQINETTKEVAGTAKEMTKFRGNNETSTNIERTIGQKITPKLNNLPLYETSNKSSKVKTKLSKNSDIIYAGNVSSNGLIEVTTEYGNGWVESHLIH